MLTRIFFDLYNKMENENITLDEDKQRFTESYFAAININNLELFRILKLHFKEIEQIYPLIEFVIERIETVIALTVDNRIWDAEIILRSAMETLAKLIFITTTKGVERENRIYEFWNLLAEINVVKQSEQAKKNLKHLEHLEIPNIAFKPLLLTEQKEKILKAKWTKVERQKLEQKWSFTEIVKSLSKNYRGNTLGIFETLSHSYRLSSHVTHGDETGILIILERNNRPDKAKELAYFVHYIRLLSDSFSFCCLVAIESMHFLNLDADFFLKNLFSLEHIESLADKYNNELFQDKDYDKYR